MKSYGHVTQLGRFKQVVVEFQTQDIAIRCIQKNVRKFMGVRGWPWWRLLIKITPMLNVHRTENQLKSQTVIIIHEIVLHSKVTISHFQEELEALRAKFEKVDKERLELKQQNEKLESRVSCQFVP